MRGAKAGVASWGFGRQGNREYYHRPLLFQTKGWEVGRLDHSVASRAEVPPTNSPSELKKGRAWTPHKIVSSHQHKHKQGNQFWSKALFSPVSWSPIFSILWWGPIRILGPRTARRAFCSVFWVCSDLACFSGCVGRVPPSWAPYGHTIHTRQMTAVVAPFLAFPSLKHRRNVPPALPTRITWLLLHLAFKLTQTHPYTPTHHTRTHTQHQA